MLKRIRVTLTWQRLIGLASGTFGGGVAIATGAQLSMANSFGVLSRPREFIPAICGCVFLLLAFPLYTGRDWARRVLLLATYCTLVAIAISFSFVVFQQPRSPSASHPGLSFVVGVCALVCVLTPPAFLLAALHHADIRRAFQRKNASNPYVEVKR